MSVKSLRTAARAWLRDTTAPAGSRVLQQDVTSVVAIVKTGDAAFSVAIDLSGGAMRAVCTCGVARCAHVLALATELASSGEAKDSSPEVTAVVRPERRVSASGSFPSPFATTPEQREELTRKLVPLLRELMTATVRSGLRGSAAPREEATRQLLAAMEGRPLVGLRRLVARLDSAVRAGDAQRAGLALHTLATLGDDLAAGPAAKLPRVAVALGEGHERTTVSDRTWVELGRERLPLAGWKALVRRYLFDVRGENLIAEDVITGSGSEGPSPRTINVGLGEVAAAPSPRAAWLRQYSVAPGINAAAWAAIESAAEREVAQIVRRYRRELQSFGALAEPICLFAPTETREQDETLELVDAHGRFLPLARSEDPAGCDALVEVVRNVPLRLVLGRLVHADETLCIVPLTIVLDWDHDRERDRSHPVATAGPRAVRLL